MKASEHGGKVANGVGMWCYSADEQTFHGTFATREEAIAEARAMLPGQAVYVGVGVEVDVSSPNPRSLIEDMGESVYGEVGEVAEGYLCDVPNAVEEELDAGLMQVVAAWLTRHNLWPTFYAVGKVEKVKPEPITEATP